MNQLISLISSFGPLDSSTRDDLLALLTKKEVKKGSAVILTNKYCRDLFFITKGLVKMQFNTDGNEFIMRFFEEHILFTNLESVSTGSPSHYDIIAIEDTEFITIPYHQFEKLCAENHTLETFFRKYVTHANVNMMARIKEMLQENAKERYDNFLQTNSHIVQRISLGDLAKYLGITQVSLSRIRSMK